MTLRLVVADDEPLARERIRSLLAARTDCVIVAECRDGVEAALAIAQHAPDVVLLDIRMPELDGFDVLAALEAEDHLPAVIFVTAFGDHAVRAFEVGAVDYLMKPFDADRLGQAIDRAASRHLALSDVRAILAALHPDRRYPERFLVRAPGHMYFVPAGDVEWVDAASNYVRLHAGGRLHLVRDTMTALESRLPADRFVRIHRSVIVRIDRIARIEPTERGEYRLILHDGTKLTSSQTYSPRVRALLR
ncbi:MAG TPA: LytTR family DNA-binding domain-containing protein [Gemmatimonadales bacterium]|jgi:two-component system LytT family response regulator